MTEFSPVKLVDHLWSKYFDPELQVNPGLTPEISVVKVKVTPGNLNSSIFNQIQKWHSKEYTKGACICFNFDYEDRLLLKGSELKNVTKNWNIIKFKEATNADELYYNSDMIMLASDGDTTTTVFIWTLIASAISALFYYFFMSGDEEGIKCRALFF